jgi:hypothetical protein
VVWGSRFDIHHRVVRSPRTGGKGMNTGIQDSISIAQPLTNTLKEGDDAPSNCLGG